MRVDLRNVAQGRITSVGVGCNAHRVGSTGVPFGLVPVANPATERWASWVPQRRDTTTGKDRDLQYGVRLKSTFSKKLVDEILRFSFGLESSGKHLSIVIEGITNRVSAAFALLNEESMACAESSN